MKSNRSYRPETANLGFDLCNLDFYPLILNFCIEITCVIGYPSWKFHDRETDRETDWQKDTVIFLRKIYMQMLSAKCLAIFSGLNKYRLIRCLFFTKVFHQPKLNREIVHFSKFHNKILYQSKKKKPDTFSTSSKCLQDPKWKSRLCSTIFIISY